MSAANTGSRKVRVAAKQEAMLHAARAFGEAAGKGAALEAELLTELARSAVAMVRVEREGPARRGRRVPDYGMGI